MGDLSYEYQDAVTAANYVTKEQWDKQLENKAIELVYSVPQNTNIEDIERTLQEAIEENQDLSIQTLHHITRRSNNDVSFSHILH